MNVVLFDWGPSPFCLKVRAILDYKGIEYRRSNALPRIFELYRRGRIGKVPALDIDGRLIMDSTNIAHEIERLYPNPRIIPEEPFDAALCHALDDWADEALYFIGLYYQWIDPEGVPMLTLAFNDAFGRFVLPFFKFRVRRQIRAQGTGRKVAIMIQEDLERELATVAGLIRNKPFLLGDRPSLCDFSLMAQLHYMSRPPASARLLTTHPEVADYIQRVQDLRSGNSRNDG